MNILSNDVFGYYTESTGVVQIKGINNISAMATDRNGNIWMSTKKSGIVMYDGKTFTKFTAADYDIPTNCTNSLIIDKDNKIWFGASQPAFSQACLASRPNLTSRLRKAPKMLQL